MKILLLGKNGQLGWELDQQLNSKQDFVALDYPQVDLGNPDNLRSIINSIEPDLIINAGAYTAVDDAEKDVRKSSAINGKGPGVLAEIVKSLDAILIHYSTDYVFDGTNDRPHIETDLPNPINQYGKSKLEGEEEIRSVDGKYIILRTAWVYDTRSDNFVTRVMNWAREKESIRIVDDQISNPTRAKELARATVKLIESSDHDYHHWFLDRKGLYHLAGDGYISRFGWAEKILELAPTKDDHLVKEMIPVKSTEFITPASRPLFSALDTTKFFETFNFRLPPWDLSLEMALKSIPDDLLKT